MPRAALPKLSILIVLLLTSVDSSTAFAQTEYQNATPPRPNILWLTAEDLSPTLGCYGDTYAHTPNLNDFASESVRFTRAFATAPVCSPARSCLITGMYATSLGTQRLRSHFPVPEFVRGFSGLLRDAGYYCTNNVKTDYNVQNEREFIEDAWNESSMKAHWRSRRANQPFFSVFNSMTTHQSRTSVWPQKQFEREIRSRLSPNERHDPEQANLPPFYPDTEEARREWARYHDCITRMDQEVGELLAQLEEDGLAENTIVFFFGDHGMGMPRGKRVLHDSGMRVPLIVRFPEKWQHLAPAARGESTDRLVSFVDFAPTVLSLCSVEIPDHMQGMAFLGEAAGSPREFAYGARDRVDEVFDLSRSVRDDRWLYIRNFMPHHSWMPPERYSDASTFRQEFKRLAAAGELDADQLTYAAPMRAIEELYDTHADPHQLKNLADDPHSRDQLETMRSALRDWMLETRDAGFLTEPQMWERIAETTTPYELVQQDEQYPLPRLLGAAELVGRPAQVNQLPDLLRDSESGIRYWAAVGASAADELSEEHRSTLREQLKDPEPVVRIEAAFALAMQGDLTETLPVLERELQNTESWSSLHAARAIELLGPKAAPLKSTMQSVLAQTQPRQTENDILLFLTFSLEAALENLGAETNVPLSSGM